MPPLDINNLSPEMQETLRLEGIFMPEARRQRDKLYRENPYPKFVHYTKADAALSIIGQKRLWLRNTTVMADYREVHHGFQLLQKFFHEKAKETAFINACDACHLGAAKEAIDHFNKWWSNTEHGIQTRTYIASISEHSPSEDQHGRLSMWRAFGSNAPARVAVVFRVPTFTGAMDFLNCTFSPVAYLSEAGAHAVIEEVIANIQKEAAFLKGLNRGQFIGYIFATFVGGVTCLKHEGFVEEREWRVIYLPGQRSSPHMEEEVISVGGVPQVIYKLPLDKSVAPELDGIDLAAMFDSLIIGPSSQPWVLYEAFTRALRKLGVQNPEPKVLTSGIPLRSF